MRHPISTLCCLLCAALLFSGCLPEGSGIKPRADAEADSGSTSGTEADTSGSTSGTEADTSGSTSGTEADTSGSTSGTEADTISPSDTIDPPDGNGVDECQTNNGGCDPLTQCIDTPTSRACGPCPAGYLGLGDTGCSDINECANGTDNCSDNATCTNSFGAFSCECNAGFFGDGVTCEREVCGGMQCSGQTPYLDAQRCQCVQCIYSTHCGGNQCNNGVCSTCSCPPSTTCSGNECIPVTSCNPSCGPGTVCQNNACVPTSGCGSGCPQGTTCQGSTCVPTGSGCGICPDGSSCDTVTQTCYTPGATCTTNADCRTTCGQLGLCDCLGAADSTSCRPEETCTELFPGFPAFCSTSGSPFP
jgi:hypothetical protein